MAGNQQAYQTYMTAGYDAAWEQNWDSAIRYYSLALQEFNEDFEAHINLGLSLLRAERLGEAIRVYDRAIALMPNEPEPLERSADVLEQMGNLKEASQRYVRVADLFLQQRDVDKAIAAWERAIELTPGMVAIHGKLARAYEHQEQKPKAFFQYLMLGFYYGRSGDIEKGLKAVERAIAIKPKDSQALNMLAALRSGGELLPPQDENGRRGVAPAKRLDSDFTFMDEPGGTEATNTGDPLGPLGDALNHALNLLAAYVLEQGLLDATGADALAAMEAQRMGDHTGASAAYLRAVKALPHPALKMNLGGMLVLQDQPDEAVRYLGDALVEPSLSAGAMHALGVAYAKLGKHKQANRYLIQCLQAIEGERGTASPQEIAQVYGSLLEALSDSTPDALQSINDRFIRTLTGEDWPQRVVDLRQHLNEIGGIGGASGIEEFLGSEGGDELADSVARIDRYIREGRLVLAMDEAHQAVEQAPNYLPAHVRMAEIMVKEGRLRQAINKYYIVARVYLIREEYDRAASVLSEVLDMAPLDTAIRQELISVLEYQGRTDEALTHYIQLGQTYKQLGNIDGARESYVVAEGIARRGGSRGDILTIKHAIADIDVSRLDTRRAMRLYEEILELNPEDERAYRQLTEILLNQNSPVEAMRRLDTLLGMYAKQRQVTPILKTLEELVRLYPNEIGLRSRLAGIYRQMGRKDDALRQLDALGDLQLKAGLSADAAVTVKQIIKMEPPNIEQYRVLLQQLEG